MMTANQMRFTITIKYTASEIGNAIPNTSVSYIGGNSIGGSRRNYIDINSNNSINSTRKVGIGFVGMGFGSNNIISSIAKIGANNNPEDAIVYLDVLSATAIDPTFS